MDTIKLNDGNKLPSIGFGTYLLQGSKGVEAMVSALRQGYRLLDTAYNYENEGAVGKAITESNINRSDLWVTSKLPGRYHEKKYARIAIEESLYRAGLSYFDLYLIHWPNPLEGKYVEAWEALIEAKKDGLIRSIGVSNFLPEHIDALYEKTGVYPTVNQIELHPYFNQHEVWAYHQERGIVLEAWSPFGRAGRVVEDELLKEIATKYGKTVNQIILRWNIQLGIVPVPKSSNPTRQLENLSIFDFSLSNDDMAAINSLTRVDGRRANQDPSVYQEF